MSKKIWVVYNPDGRAPHYTHQSFESAKQEAKRLARNNPDQRFFVMESVAMAIKRDVDFCVYSSNVAGQPQADLEDEIPF